MEMLSSPTVATSGPSECTKVLDVSKSVTGPCHIAGRVAIRELAQQSQLPMSDQQNFPSTTGGARSALHHRIVDRFATASRRTLFGVQPDEAEVVDRRFHRSANRCDDLRLEALGLIDQQACRKQEVAGVPRGSPR